MFQDLPAETIDKEPSFNKLVYFFGVSDQGFVLKREYSPLHGTQAPR